MRAQVKAPLKKPRESRCPQPMCLPMQELHPAFTVAHDAQDAHLLMGGSFVQQATHHELAASSAPVALFKGSSEKMVKFRTIVLNIRGWGHIIIKVFDSIKQK